ncbi:unnamed protein product [Phytophthora fragariaefolia]|uniref:Unnamed protein product n=1 Tax=Phytophthora fragariaefolia TaxID=1490495 RepID=A0A9W7CW85_9STRA|nr:unnamed protein product [Phytophthora fragariaefolia]
MAGNADTAEVDDSGGRGSGPGGAARAMAKRKAPAAPTQQVKRPTRPEQSHRSGSKAAEKMVAFLRGVNVGGRVHSMRSIAHALGGAGLGNVETFLASGNVVFDAPADRDEAAVEHRVEAVLEGLFGCHIPVLARSLDDVARLGDRIVKSATAVNVVLLKEPLTQEQRVILQTLSTDADELELLGKEFVWYSATKMSESPLFKVAFDKKLGVPVTVRTVNTLRRIAKKFG